MILVVPLGGQVYERVKLLCNSGWDKRVIKCDRNSPAAPSRCRAGAASGTGPKFPAAHERFMVEQAVLLQLMGNQTEMVSRCSCGEDHGTAVNVT